ncbi:transposase [Chelativorans petroleitrophicus]|uniref:transposase n=1 Tax=Chelativorans petroleitrophicus TaxID=2975484 RepID=UPI0021BFF699|nr:transposase [Chelativorans petroleitrophicus]
MKRGENSSEGICLIHGEPTDLEVGDVHEDDREGLDGGAGGVPGLTAVPWRQGSRRPAVSGSDALFLGSQHHLAGAAGAVRQMEQRMETLRPVEQGRRVRDLLRPSGFAVILGASGPDIQLDHRARPCLGSRGKRGQKGQALGRSRGGFSTKIHLKTDFDGHLIAFDLTGGEKGDAPHFPILPGLGPDVDPRAAVADKGYASKANRQAARSRGIIPVIPRKANEKGKPGFFAKAIYKGRARIERAVGKLKRFSVSSYDARRRSGNFASIVALAAGFTLVKSVHIKQE